MHDHKHERGAILFISILILAIMGAVSIAALQTASTEKQAAGFYNRTDSSFYVAEAAVSHARALVKQTTSKNEKPVFPNLASGTEMIVGDAALYDREANLPIYFGDPAFADPIRWVQDGPALGGSNLQANRPKQYVTLWQINVIGQSPDGRQTRIEVMDTKAITGGAY